VKTYSFYYVGKKYPSHIGIAEGETKKEAFESLKKSKGYSDNLKLGTKVKGYIHA
jgi:hypothetical protein